MRVAPQTIICWCILAMVLPLVKGTKVDLNSNMKKRFRVWLQSRMKADFLSSAATGEVDSAIVIGSQQREKTDLPQLHSRSRRSTVTSVKRPGCALGTCALHDLGHRLNHYNNKLNTSAPEEKMSSKGYGRRRRRSLPKCYARLTLQAGRLRLGWSSEPSQTGLNQAGEWRGESL